MKNKIYSLLYLVFVCSTIVAQNTVNAVIDDISFVKKYHRQPTLNDNYNDRITTHLKYVLALLKKENPVLDSNQKLNRTIVLNHLQTYIQQANYPSNRKYPNQTRPCFIDSVSGNICAVGYLIAQTEDMEMAHKINAIYQYEYIKNMQLPEINIWLKKYGLSVHECAMIQPSYVPKPNPTPKQIAEQKERLRKQKLLEEKYKKQREKDEKNMKYKKQSLIQLLQNKTFTIGIINKDYSEDSTYDNFAITLYFYYVHDTIVEDDMTVIYYNKKTKLYEYLQNDIKSFSKTLPNNFDKKTNKYEIKNYYACINANCDTIVSGFYFTDFYFKNKTWYWKPRCSTFTINLKETKKENTYIFEQTIIEKDTLKWDLIK
jgi:hypothetical protein